MKIKNVAIFVLIVLVGIFAINTLNFSQPEEDNNLHVEEPEKQMQSLDELIETAEYYDYDDIQRNIDGVYTNKIVYYEGRVDYDNSLNDTTLTIELRPESACLFSTDENPCTIYSTESIEVHDVQGRFLTGDTVLVIGKITGHLNTRGYPIIDALHIELSKT